MGGDPLELPEDIRDGFEAAASILDEYDKFRIYTHYDADGISSAAVLSRALMRSQKGFHTSFLSSFPEKLSSDLPLIFTDFGNSHLDRLNQLDQPVIVLDHHNTDIGVEAGKEKIFINPHDFGINGAKEVSGGTLSFLLAIAFDEKNWSQSVYGLAGAAADKQNIGGFTGLNNKIVEEAVKRGKLEVRNRLYLDGEGIEDSLMKACDPYFPGISGRKATIKKILKEIGLDSSTPVNEISSDKDRELTSILVLSLMENNIPTHIVESIKGKDFIDDENGLSVEILYKLLNSCARVSKPGLGLSLCLGDPSAKEKAEKLRDDYREQMIRRLRVIEEEGIEQMDHIQYFYEEKRTRKGELAGLGMLYILSQEKPTIGLTKIDDRVDISCRATKKLVKSGIDLGLFCREIARKLDGSGGGHDIAAGATIPLNKDKKFLELMDEHVGKILG